MKRKYYIYKKLFFTLSICSVAGFILFKIIPFPSSSTLPKKEVKQSPILPPSKSPLPPKSTPLPEPKSKTIIEDANDNETIPTFSISSIPNSIFKKMQGNSFKENCTLFRQDLSYLIVPYYGFDEEIHTGELIVNSQIAEDVQSIFQELLEAKYPIEKIKLIDEYKADDQASMSDNNTSAFNFRFIEGTTHLSNHAAGFAIDINPLYNPYVRYINKKEEILPENSDVYADRTKDFLYKIDENDLCYQIFTKYGFEWGGHWNSSKDYQHFEKIITK